MRFMQKNDQTKTLSPNRSRVLDTERWQMGLQVVCMFMSTSVLNAKNNTKKNPLLLSTDTYHFPNEPYRSTKTTRKTYTQEDVIKVEPWHICQK